MDTNKAMKIAGCSKSFLLKLLKEGKIKGHQAGNKKHWEVTATREELAQIRVTNKRIGFTKSSVKKKSVNTNLLNIIRFVEFPNTTRELLFKIGQKFNEQELKILLEL